MPARGIRNNNPGNIRKGEKWKGLSPIQNDSSFCVFKSPEYGIVWYSGSGCSVTQLLSNL